MSKIGKDEILDKCINGIKKSFKEYLKWSDDEWLWNAPEYLITVNIAKELSAIEGAKFITLEDNIKKTLKTANAKIKGKLSKNIRPDGRSDIVLWWGKGTPRGIIEVKNAIYRKDNLEDDLNRIYGLLKKSSDIEFGITTFYIDRNYKNGNATKTLERRINNEFIEKIKIEVLSHNFKYKPLCKEILSDENNSAFAVALMIYK